MNIFEIFGTIGLKDQGFNKGISDATEKGESFGTKFGNVMANIGKTAAVGLGAATTAFAGLSIKALQAGGELEQNLGGAEAVLGKFAETAINTSQTAFETAGLSASDYLATINKMGALMMGSGIEQEKALDLSSAAMQRAADVASIMGIDISAAMESVAGAAKGNFTMMDNLGVAMNATTIQAYAFSKGMQRNYADMDNATKVGLAMEMFLEKTAYAAGNYAKENETLAGSLSTAQAALSNFLSGAGDADTLVISVTNLTGVISKNLLELLPRLTEGLTTVISGLLPQIPILFAALLPAIVDGASTLINGVITTIPALVDVFVKAIPQVVYAVLSMLPLMLDAGIKIVASIIKGIASTLPDLIPAAVETIITLAQNLIDNLPLILDAAFRLIEGLTTGIINSIPVLIEKLPEIINSIVIFLNDNLPKLIQTGVDLLTALIADMPTIIKTILHVLPNLINSLLNALLGNIPIIINAGIQLFMALIEALPEIIQDIVAVLPQIIDAIVDAFINNIDAIVDAGVQFFVALIENLPAIIVEIIKAVPQIINALVKEFDKLSSKIVEVGGNLIKGIWQGIKDAGAWLKDKISGFFGGVVDSIKNFFGIKSPSKLFEKEIGAMLPAGMAEGIEGGISKAVSAAKSMADAVFEAASGDAQFGITFGETADLGFKNGAAEYFTSKIKLPETIGTESQTIGNIVLDGINQGFAMLSDTILNALPDVLKFNIDSREMGEALFNASNEAAIRRNRLFAPTIEQISAIAQSVIPR